MHDFELNKIILNNAYLLLLVVSLKVFVPLLNFLDQASDVKKRRVQIRNLLRLLIHESLRIYSNHTNYLSELAAQE
jgi:hypothetical protein